jgi:hypothetical protein
LRNPLAQSRCAAVSNARRVLWQDDCRFINTLSYSSKTAPSRSRLACEPRASASGFGYVSELLKPPTKSPAE